ncbi:MAG: hypothetical protein ACK4SR_03650 [Thiobacillus sp.]
MHFLNHWNDPRHPEYDFAARQLVYRNKVVRQGKKREVQGVLLQAFMAVARQRSSRPSRQTHARPSAALSASNDSTRSAGGLNRMRGKMPCARVIPLFALFMAAGFLVIELRKTLNGVP